MKEAGTLEPTESVTGFQLVSWFVKTSRRSDPAGNLRQLSTAKDRATIHVLKCLGCAPRFEVFFTRQAHGRNRGLALLTDGRRLATIGSGQDREMVVFWAGVADDFGQFIGVTFGTLRANEIGAGRVQLGAALQAQVTVRVGVARLGSGVFAATGKGYQGD